MSKVPVVQGTPVGGEGANSPLYKGQQNEHDASNFDVNMQSSYSAPGSFEYHNYSEAELRHLRETPLKKYQDVTWAGIFVVHFIAMAGLIVWNCSSPAYSRSGGQGGGSGDRNGVQGDICFLVVVTGLCGVAAASLSVSLMMRHTTQLVQTALVFSVAFSGLIAFLGILSGNLVLAGVGLLAFGFGVCYARAVWPRIPFAAQNLKTALSAVQQNMGLAVMTYAFTGIAFLWTVAWFWGLGGALSGSSYVVVFLFLLSFYWVLQVLQNTAHVTVAGTVATWWFVPDEARSFFSQGLSDSLVRATTYSFGSVCFGSLLVAIVQAIRALERHARSNDEFQFLACIIQCILSCIQSIIEYMNKWAYVYVAMYGFSYLEAGQNVITLFKNKGWTAVITDDLSDNVLFMISVSVALLSGLIGLALGAVDSRMFAQLGYDNAAGPGFAIGFLTGYLSASVMMSVVASAVTTVIVCYAEDPAIFQMNHPQLAVDMRSAWTEAFPTMTF